MASTPVAVTQSSVFARAYKKLHLQQKQDVDKAVEAIILEPLSGEAKRGDLAGIYVYKFKSQNQLVLLAYEFDPKTRHLLLLGSHENFYRELKR
jgi:mRNA interferase RelE/StbE